LLLLVGAYTVYSLFFNKPTVGSIKTETAVTNDSALQNNREVVNNTSESNRTAKEEKPPAVKKQKRDSVTKTALPKTTIPKPVAKQPVRDEAAEKPAIQKTTSSETATDDVSDKTETTNSVRYTVRNKAFFHDEPSNDTRRGAFIVHWNKAVLQPLDEKNGFVYVVYKNHLGQTSKGWLAKDDLVALK
jgi:hypothetical protein